MVNRTNHPLTRTEVTIHPNTRPTRVDAFVKDLYAQEGFDVSRQTVKDWIEQGRVTCDGAPVKPSTRIRPGMRLIVDPAPPPPSDATPDDSVHVEILFEDRYLLVVNKPAGLVVHPARGHHTGTLVNGLLALGSFSPQVVEEAMDDGATFRPGIVHRLDKDTSGVLVVAKTARAREGLKELFATHDIERAYRAVVVGRANDATYDTPHGRHPRNRLKFTSIHGAGETKRAITHVTKVEQLARGLATLVECRLETGRTHQIRVHMAEQARCPVLGDALYGSKKLDQRLQQIADNMGRHWLHAYVLGFVHPITAEPMHFEAPVPDELREALERLRSWD